MANLKNLCEFYDMRLHKTAEDDILASDMDQLLNDYLPRTYAEEVIEEASSQGLIIQTDPRYIRNVRNGRYKDSDVFLCILTVAVRYKESMDNLKETLKKVTA